MRPAKVMSSTRRPYGALRTALKSRCGCAPICTLPSRRRKEAAGTGAVVGAARDADETLQALTERARKDPAVSRLLTEFGAQVVDVRPLRPAVVEENG